jgi:hypothetical protein
MVGDATVAAANLASTSCISTAAFWSVDEKVMITPKRSSGFVASEPSVDSP